MKITRLVLDVMSPAQQSMVDLAEKLYEIEGIFQIDITLLELEQNIEEFKVTMDGFGLNYEKIKSVINDFGAVIRNIDSMTSRQLPSRDDDRLSASMLVLSKHIDSDVSKIDQVYSEFDEALKHILSRKA